MTTNDMPPVIDSILGDSIEVGDQLMINNEMVQVQRVEDDEDFDYVNVTTFSLSSNDVETHHIHRDHAFDVWGIFEVDHD